MQRNAVILAGKGTRMKSNKYKVLHKVGKINGRTCVNKC